jgi:hypothetical protein
MAQKELLLTFHITTLLFYNRSSQPCSINCWVAELVKQAMLNIMGITVYGIYGKLSAKKLPEELKFAKEQTL